VGRLGFQPACSARAILLSSAGATEVDRDHGHAS
jgi:hypothetical protein